MLNKFLEALGKFAKWVFIVLLTVAIIAASVCLGLEELYDERKAGSSPLIKASAEVPTDTPNADITLFDIENYPSANYFDVTKITVTSGSYYIKEVSNGIVNSVVTSTGGVLKNGLANTTVTLREIAPELKADETYTLSFVSSSTNGKISVGSSSESWESGTSRILSQEDLDNPIGFYSSYGGLVYSEIIINKGTTAYPYFPYYYSFYNAGVESGYNEGYIAGESEGYIAGELEGYTQGLGVGKYSFLYDCEVNFYFTNVGSTGENRRLTTKVNTYTDVGFSLYQFYSEVSSVLSPYSSCESIDVTLMFADPPTMGFFDLDIYSDYLTKIYVDDNTDLFYGQLPEPQDSIYQISLESSFSNLTSSSVVHGFGLILSGSLNALRTSVSVSDVSYDVGYHVGFGEGRLEGYDEGYDVGSSEGYDEGYSFGYALGKNSVSGDTLSNSVKSFVFSLFDAPVSTFTGVFDFEYDGFDIGSLVAFIFSIAVVAGVLKVVL